MMVIRGCGRKMLKIGPRPGLFKLSWPAHRPFFSFLFRFPSLAFCNSRRPISPLPLPSRIASDSSSMLARTSRVSTLARRQRSEARHAASLLFPSSLLCSVSLAARYCSLVSFRLQRLRLQGSGACVLKHDLHRTTATSLCSAAPLCESTHPETPATLSPP